MGVINNDHKPSVYEWLLKMLSSFVVERTRHAIHTGLWEELERGSVLR